MLRLPPIGETPTKPSTSLTLVTGGASSVSVPTGVRALLSATVEGADGVLGPACSSCSRVGETSEAMEQQDDDDDGREMIEQLKEKFTSTTSRSERLTILTVLPKRWSVAKVMEEFGVTNYMARSAKKLVEDKGVLSTPDSNHLATHWS